MKNVKTNFSKNYGAINAHIITTQNLKGDKKMGNSNNLTELPMGKDITIKKEIEMKKNNELLKTKVSLFNTLLNTKHPKHVELEEILLNIQNGTYKSEVLCSRQKLKISPKACDDYNLANVPEFTLSAHCNHRVSDAKITPNLPKKLINHTGFLQIDIPGLGKKYDKTRQIIIKDKHTLFCYTSLSGDGLKVGIRIDGNYHEESFKQAMMYYSKTYNIKINPIIKSLYQTCSISYDPDIYVNREAEIFKIKKKEHALI